MFSKIASTFISGIALASACTTPSVQLPGNSVFKPGVTDKVPVGVPFEVTWDGTGLGSTVTLILLRGPGTNILPIQTIVEGTPNTGSYMWTPSTDLEDDVARYGIQMIDDATCKFQYTTQFGVSNPGGGQPKPSSSKSVSVEKPSTVSEYKPPAKTPSGDYKSDGGYHSMPYEHHGGPGGYDGEGDDDCYTDMPKGTGTPYHHKGNQTSYTTIVTPTAPSYTGPAKVTANGAERKAFSFAGAIVAVGFAVALL